MSMGLPQWGQAKVLMFSTTPRTSTLTWRNISMALRTSARATVEGVVTTTAPVTATVWMSVSCTSPVPGGRSMTRWSSSPHSTLRKNCVITLCSIGPRQIIGLSPGLSRPIEIIFSPCDCTGMMCLSAVASGCCVAPSIIGTFGPYTSASSNPTLCPSFAKASARFTATVVLPTPPLPLATATRFFTPGIGWRSGCCMGAGPGGICFLYGGTGILACPLFNQFAINLRARLRQRKDTQECLSYSSAVALLVFFPGPAGARIVAPHFCANPHRLRRLRLRGPGLILQIFLLALLAALDFARHSRQLLRSACTRGGAGCGSGCALRRGPRRLGPSGLRRLLALLHLNVEEIADRFVVDARHHVFEEDKRFLLELDDGIFLRVAAEPDALFQVVQREQVVFPLRIDHVENDAAFEPAHQVRAELFFLFLVTLLDSLDRGVGKLVVGQCARIGARSLHVDAELRVALRKKWRGVPLAGMLLARTERFDQFAHDVFGDSQNVIALILAFQRGAANGINRLALLVHHIVVFEKVFSGVEVLRFHGFLRVLDTARQHLRFDGHALGHAHAEH